VSEPPRRSVDVVVVGAGPAGTSTAIRLADHGLHAIVIDKAVFPRDKTCGDGLTTLALRELEGLGLAPTDVASWRPVTGAVLHSPRGRTVELPLPEGDGQFAAVARRLDLDAALVALAEQRGVELVQGAALRDARQDAEGVELLTDAGELRARWVVGADGMWSPLRKALHLDEGRYRGEWHGFRQYLAPAGRRADELHIWFEPDLLPGYAWSFPLPDGRANVGFGVLRGRHLDGKALADQWRRLLARPALVEVLGPSPEPEGPHRAWPIPARITTTTLAAGRVLFVGDAARATDVFTGEGIGQALLTGRLAAEAIVRAVDGGQTPERVSDAYRREALGELAPDHRMASTLSRMMSSSLVGEASIALVGLNDWTRRNTARWLFEDSPRGIALTPRRWRRGVLSGPAAYRAQRQQVA
jgi:menaquinone-9 beta-reductase